MVVGDNLLLNVLEEVVKQFHLYNS